MRPVAVTTAFATALDLVPERVVDLAQRAGVAGVILDAGLDPAREAVLATALPAGGVPLLAVEAPCPRSRASSASLVAPDREEARTALEAVLETLRTAGERGCPRVVVRLGTVRELEPDWPGARDRYLRGDLGPAYARRMAAHRDASPRPLDAARRALDRLARVADDLGVILLVPNPRRLVDAPSPRELDQLRAELRGAPLRPAFDAAAAHLADDMGVWPLELTVASFAADAGLASLGDAAGAVGGLVPHTGVLPLAALAARVPEECLRVFAPSPLLTAAEVLAGVAAVARL